MIASQSTHRAAEHRSGALRRHPVAASSNPVVIRDAVNDLTRDEHALKLHEGSRINGNVNGTHLGPLAFVHVSYGAAVTISSPPTRDRILVVFPRGPMHVESASHQWLASTPFALSTTRHTLMVPDPLNGALIAGVDTNVAASQFARISGRTLHQPLTLDSERPLQLATSELVARTWMEGCAALDEIAGQQDPLTALLLLNTLFSTLLLGLSPHLSCFEPGILPASSYPGYLQAAKAFIERNYPLVTGVSMVAQAVGISPRQLQSSFTKYLGCTPNQYLRNVRLDAAHTLLRTGNPGGHPSVSSIAASVGIDHLGRFSSYYCQRFGQPPSETLAGAHRNPETDLNNVERTLTA
ncbi:AraC family transcriptional regulator [Glutamicibacter sp. MNS18]|uniref:helix-turn-helix transcriptional regulator n=1 Tax=Glutamicibacter sp. MNS18 TaxID=2989817 RepID=UPI0022366396|nr:AraC family transcriptional regulator [Glutamicibacter sp. MNS18]MCW4465309.1 AraC family transcriptional regulator [Glutamicibacter sp. MNS18]